MWKVEEEKGCTSEKGNRRVEEWFERLKASDREIGG